MCEVMLENDDPDCGRGFRQKCVENCKTLALERITGHFPSVTRASARDVEIGRDLLVPSTRIERVTLPLGGGCSIH